MKDSQGRILFPSSKENNAIGNIQSVAHESNS